MKVCLIHNLWGAYARGGGERAIENIAAGLRERGIEVFVITTKPWGAVRSADKGVYELGSGYHFLDHWPVPLRLLWHFLNLLNPFKYFQVRSILRRERPDTVWTHNLTGFGFLIFKLAAHCRHIHTVHDIQLLHPSGLMFYGHENTTKSLPARMYQSLLRGLISSEAMVIFPSRWIEHVHLGHSFFTSNKRLVINNPLNEVVLPSSAKVREALNALTRFLFVGQIEVHKGIVLLLEAFAALETNKELTIIGEGSLLPGLRKEYAGQAISFLGWQTKEQIRTRMENSDCLVVPSLCYENQPTVILEAQAAGLSVVASNIGGIPELIPTEALFEPTVAALSKKMGELSVCEPVNASPLPGIRTVSEYIDAVLKFLPAVPENA